MNDNSIELRFRCACDELANRVRSGQEDAAESLLRDHPEFAADPQRAAELVYTEYVIRDDSGQNPCPSEFINRFPQWRDRLERLFQIDEAISSASDEVLRPHEPPSRIPGYHVIRPLGSGGMGSVYLAEQLLVKRMVALKVLHPFISQEREVVERFHREAVILGMLSHANIASIYASGVENGVHFLAMQYCQGESLQTLLDERERLGNVGGNSNPQLVPDSTTRLDVPNRISRRALAPGSVDEQPAPVPDSGNEPGASAPRLMKSDDPSSCQLREHSDSTGISDWPGFVLKLMLRVADAISYAHSHGVLHRDIKPSNVIVNISSGDVWVVDFGLAKAVMSGERTLTVGPLGTPGYASPEQLNTGHVDERSDVYAMGITLRRLLSRRDGDEGSLTWLPGIDENIPHVVARATEREPELRYQSIDAMRMDLDALARGQPPRASRIVFARRAALRIRRHKVLVAVATLLLSLTASIAFLYSVERAKSDAVEYERTIENAVIELYVAQLLSSPEAREQRFFRHFEDVHALKTGVTSNPLRDVLLDLDAAAAILPHRPEAYYYRARTFVALSNISRASQEVDRALACQADFVPARLLRATLDDRLRASRNGKGSGAQNSELAATRSSNVERVPASRLSFVRRSPSRRTAFHQESMTSLDWRDEWSRAELATDENRWLDAADAYRYLLDSLGNEPFAGYSVECNLGRATAYLKAAKYAPAIESFAVVSARWPFVRETSLFIGKAYFLSGDETRAAEVFHNTWLTTAHPDMIAAWVGSFYHTHGRPSETDVWMRKIADGYLQGLGLTATLVGTGEAGEKSARHLLATFGDRASTYDQLAEALLVQGKLSEAIAAAQKAIDLDSSLAYPYLRLGTALLKSGEFEPAMRAFQQVIDVGGKDSVFYYHVGARLADGGRLEEAVDMFRTALKIDPRLADAHHNLGYAYADLNRIEEAAIQFEEVIRIDAGRRVYEHLGEIYSQSGKWCKSFDAYVTALALDPRNQVAADALLELLRSPGPHQCHGGGFHISCGGGKRLMEVLERTVITHENAQLLSILALTYYHTPSTRGKAKAIETACRAVEAPHGDLTETLDTLRYVIGATVRNESTSLHPLELMLTPPPYTAIDAVLEFKAIRDHDEAARIVQRFARISQDAETVRRSMYLEARVDQMAGRYQDAARRYQALIDQDATRPEPISRLVECLRASQDLVGEQELRERLLTLDGSSSTSASTGSIGMAQWDLDGNLESTTGGRPLVPGAARPALSADISFQHVGMSDGIAHVARFSRGSFFRVDHGLVPEYPVELHEFTLIADICLSLESGDYGTILQTDVANSNDGDWSAHPRRGVGEQRYGGTFRSDTWHRVALVVDPATMETTSYIDGRRVQRMELKSHSIEALSLRSSLLLFADEDGENSSGWINSLQIRNYAMPPSDIALLAGPQAAGIPATIVRAPGY